MTDYNCDITPLDFLKKDDGTEKYIRNNPYLPKRIFRWLVCGESGSGKTLLTTNILFKGWLDFERICIFAPSLKDNDEYVGIMDIMKEVAAKKEIPLKELLITGESISDIPPLEQLEGKRTVVVFDDFLTESQSHQKIIETYFTRGRHKSLCIFYLSQSYFSTPKLIRKNANVISLFQMDNREVQELARNLGMGIGKEKKNKLIDFYDKATGKPHGFLHIDTTQKYEWAKYRSGLDGIFCENVPEEMKDLLIHIL